MSFPGRVSRPITLIILFASLLFAVSCGREREPLAFSSTIAGLGKEFGEPFGIAVKGGQIYVSDGEKNEIRVIDGGNTRLFASGLNTPSAITFDKAGNLIVADTGSHTIKSIDDKGTVSTIAGVANRPGHADGDASSALFRAPIGVAVDVNGRIFVADTYNDRIRVIENGVVRTIAGTEPGFADGTGEQARFHTPTGIAVWNKKLLVADTGNRRIRVVEPDASVWTLAGDGNAEIKNGLLLSASFYQPTGITVSGDNEIYITDGNAIRKIAGSPIPFVKTISGEGRGFVDGRLRKARFNRPSSLGFVGDNIVLADSDNRVVRTISPDKGPETTSEQIGAMRETSEEFRNAQPPRWPYNPPDRPRDIAGTFGEIRGHIPLYEVNTWFHNGLDIAGATGEPVYAIRDETVLDPFAVSDFRGPRESLRLPTTGYVHIRVGRTYNNESLGDARFHLSEFRSGGFSGVRVPRGTKFAAGDRIGSINNMAHVHLIAGRSGSEMNAIDALLFPGIADARPPTIEKAWLTGENWQPLETKGSLGRIQVSGKIRVLLRSFDQMDGNSARRRLGLYRAGYQLLNADGRATSDTNWTMIFDRLPDGAAVPFVYAEGSNSGATGETILNYIVSNRVDHTGYREAFLDTTVLAPGSYIIRVIAADYFGNNSHADIPVEVVR